MVYLIDDNRRNQQQEYNCDFLNNAEYSSFFKPIYKIRAGTDITFLKDATCVLIHNSFPDFDSEDQAIEARTTVYEAILAFCIQHKITVVIFTNGILDCDFKQPHSDTLIRINKRLLYTNLKEFLEFYAGQSKAEPKILIHGKNFIAQDLSVIAARISSLIQTSGLQKGLQKISEQVRLFAEQSGSASVVMDKLDAVVKGNESSATFLTFLQRIIQSFFRHGRNIYHR